MNLAKVRFRSYGLFVGLPCVNAAALYVLEKPPISEVQFLLLINFGSVVSAIAAIECVLRRQELRTYILVMASCSIFYSFLMGYTMAGTDIDPTFLPECSQELTIKNGKVLNAKIIRSGERGVLLFNLDEKNIQFRKWNDVEIISAKPKFDTRC